VYQQGETALTPSAPHPISPARTLPSARKGRANKAAETLVLVISNSMYAKNGLFGLAFGFPFSPQHGFPSDSLVQENKTGIKKDVTL